MTKDRRSCWYIHMFIGHLVLKKISWVSKNQFSTLFTWNTVALIFKGTAVVPYGTTSIHPYVVNTACCKNAILCICKSHINSKGDNHVDKQGR